MLWDREKEWDRTIDTYALVNGVPVPLIKAIIAKESSFKPDAYKPEPQINDASAGLMQVLFKTAKSLGYTGDSKGLFDPLESIKYGSKLLAQNLKIAGGNTQIAVSAYNAGWSKVRRGDAPRNDEGTFVNQKYVDDVNVYYGYFSGKLTEAEVKSYWRSKLLKSAMPIFF